MQSLKTLLRFGFGGLVLAHAAIILAIENVQIESLAKLNQYIPKLLMAMIVLLVVLVIVEHIRLGLHESEIQISKPSAKTFPSHEGKPRETPRASPAKTKAVITPKTRSVTVRKKSKNLIQG